MTNKPEFFWSPPDGELIVGMVTYREIVVVATSGGIYTINATGQVDNLEVRKVLPAEWTKP